MTTYGAQRLRVPHAPMVRHIPFPGRTLQVATMALPAGFPPLGHGHEAVTQWLLRTGVCSLDGQQLRPESYRDHADWASCAEGHLVDLGPARRLIKDHR